MADEPLVLLVNDSHFAHLVAAPVIERHGEGIVRVVISTRTTASPGRLAAILRRSSFRYFAYRALLQISGWLPSGRRRRVRYQARRRGLPVTRTEDVNRLDASVFAGAEMAVAINFDQILGSETLTAFPKGVLNLHASRLPADRGISPALWAFARGDGEIWFTVYRMDEGLDTGPTFRQDYVEVDDGESAFSVYSRVCRAGGEALADTVASAMAGEEPIRQIGDSSPAHSWPDRAFAEMLRDNRRRLIRFTEALRLFV